MENQEREEKAREPLLKGVENIREQAVAMMEEGYHEATRAGAVKSLIFLMNLREFMLALKSGTLPNEGLFCGYCYGPIYYPPWEIDERGKRWCPHCFADQERYSFASSIPSQVLEVHLLKNVVKARVVDIMGVGGFGIGLILGAIIFLRVGGWMRALACLILPLSILVGAALGAFIGDMVGMKVQDRAWREFVAKRT